MTQSLECELPLVSSHTRPSTVCAAHQLTPPVVASQTELAKQAVANGEAPYGAVIVDPVTSVIMARGGNNASQNPIWHAGTLYNTRA